MFSILPINAFLYALGVVFIGKIVQRLVARRIEHLSGKRGWQYFLWTVLMFQSWLEEQKPGVLYKLMVKGLWVGQKICLIMGPGIYGEFGA